MNAPAHELLLLNEVTARARISGTTVWRLEKAGKFPQRAYDLLWDGDALGCDALIEFLPSSEVEAMLNAWSDDWDDDEKLSKPRSRWYKGEAA